MYIDLTTAVAPDSPLLAWARAQENPHIALGHVGTHIDTYEKLRIPLEYIRSPGIVLDVRHVAEAAPADIDCARIPENGVVLFRTGQMERYPYGDKRYFDGHPQLSPELIRLLCARKIRFIGVDCAGIRQHAEHEEADRLCERNGIYVIENLCNLHLLPQTLFMINVMWLDDAVMTGLKCRVIAECGGEGAGEVFSVRGTATRACCHLDD